MRVFRIKSFSRFARRQGIEDVALMETIGRAASGSIDADLGGRLAEEVRI
jgi:hypothetical protein